MTNDRGNGAGHLWGNNNLRNSSFCCLVGKMTPEEMAANNIMPTTYKIGQTGLLVEWRGDDTWAVTRGGCECMNKDGFWTYEPLPSRRDKAFLERCRFTLDEALRLALTLYK